MRSVSWILLLVCLFSLVASAGEIQESQVESLIKQLQDEDAEVRSNAVEALGQIRSKDAVPALVQTLKDPDSHVRHSAVEALGQIRSKDAVLALTQTLRDKAGFVRISAVETLKQIGTSEALKSIKEYQQSLIQALQNPNAEIRADAAETLGQIGTADVVPALTIALQDPDSWVRAASTEALQSIDARFNKPSNNNNIWMAIRVNNIEAVKQFLAEGVNVNIRADDGGTLLGFSALLGHYKIAELLIQKGATIEAKVGAIGGTALHMAAFLGRLEVVKLLIENGAYTEATDNNSETPIDATTADWVTTESALRMFNISIDREEIEAGRAKVAELLNQ